MGGDLAFQVSYEINGKGFLDQYYYGAWGDPIESCADCGRYMQDATVMETFGVNGNITAGGGFNFDVGIVRRQSDGEWRVYVSVDPSVGLDASIGVSGNTIKNYDGNKKIKFGQLEG
ncbi:hypothetical protein [Cyclobacterium marinum]|uniref:Uncharacterized protein n=1 Tax=Cyclobacterium marinum (strain ATCC 25205 / DSM 745 / LMG 13164 / NCIMB 1802) TaxID=880070 RepID=G0J451_CYCMS|nr:hypothetical protein [Cyclobacterium marinum]AEL26717.1 hypothetical protein Cycma_2988 [Cyclobacterium marinum DSM 745]